MSPLAQLLSVGAILAAVLAAPAVVALALFGGAVLVTLLPAIL